MAFKSSEKQNSEGRIRGGKDPKKKMKKMRSIKLPKLSRLNSSSERFTRQFDMSAIDLANDNFNSESKIENFEVESESEGTSVSSSSNSKSRLDQTLDNSTPHDPNDSKKSSLLDRKISKPNFTRMPSLRSVRILKGRASFKSHRSLMKKQNETAKDLNVVRATCSSTLKDSKFSKEIDILEGEIKVEELSALKVCPYHHCSLYGHCHGPELVEKKPFLRRKMLPKKIPKSKRQENEERNGVEILSYRKLESKSVLVENDLAVEKERSDLSSTGKSEENGVGVVGENQSGGKSQNEKISQENEVCKIFPENEDKDLTEIILGSTLEPEKISQEIESEYAGKILFGGKLDIGNFSRKHQKQTGNVRSPQLINESSISMWQLIHRKMAMSLTEDHDANQVLDSNSHSDSSDNSNQNILASDMSSDEAETRKNFAVKLVRDAIEKVLLPEVQDQSSANQPISEQEYLEEMNSNSSEISEQESSNGGDKKKDDFADKTAPKSWSSLKKIILLKRFVKELERVREFKLKKVQSRSLDLDEEETEKISLRHQALNGKKNPEEWMLDYAIRKVVSELAPNQKKKVLLLVKAFETVAPSQDDRPIQATFSANKCSSHQDVESNEDDIVALSSDSLEVTSKIEEEGDSTYEEKKTQMDDNECDSDSKVRVSQDDQPIQATFSTIKSSSHQDLESNEDDIVALSSNSIEVTTEIEEEGDSTYEVNKAQMDDNECDNDSLKVRVNRGKHISMWHLIHNQMVSGLEAESGVAHKEKVADNVSMTSASNSVESEDMKMRKNFAINLVREAIEKILLPEVQDSDEKNRDEDFGELKVNSEETEENKSEKPKPKSWSYLKKVILLKRFVKELEKVKKFNPRKPNYLPLEPGEAPENINLRPQTVGERRNTDEWMLDYAIRQVVSQLGPTQKAKVALLVKAFETVAPLNEESPTIVSQSSGKFTSQDEITDIKSNLNGSFVEAKNDTAIEKQNKIKIWHMVYQHVVSGIAEKVVQDEEFDNKNTAVKLVQDAVDEILDDSSDSQLDLGDSVTTVNDCQSQASEFTTPPQGETKQAIFKQKSKNWSKLKKLLLMKRAMKALGNVRKRDPHPSDDVLAKEEVNLKSQMVDERKKAEQWMLDYAVQHIVTKLTPARKRRVAMLVEAFEAVVPLPNIGL